MKADNAESMPTPTQQQTKGAGDQLNSMVGHSPFARPGSWSIHPARQPCWIGTIRRQLSQSSPTSYKTLKL